MQNNYQNTEFVGGPHFQDLLASSILGLKFDLKSDKLIFMSLYFI